MSSFSSRFEVEDRSKSGDWMEGNGQECIDFIVLCRGIPRKDAVSMVTLARFYDQLDLPHLELVITKV